MKYASQKVAYYYFAGAMILFIVQIAVGGLAATVYVLPNFLAETVPFNILRMIHTNALIVWSLMAFFGAAYYLIPEEAERDIESPAPCLYPARPVDVRRVGGGHWLSLRHS